MKKLILALCTILAVNTPQFVQAGDDSAPYLRKHESTAEDIAAISQLTKDFQTALLTKNAKMLSSLFNSPHMLFASPRDQATIDRVRKMVDAKFDGIEDGGYEAFISGLVKSKEPIQEKFYNVNITQDGNVAWVLFDYEFLRDDKVKNYGVESWQVAKIDGNWKIISVVWSAHALPD